MAGPPGRPCASSTKSWTRCARATCAAVGAATERNFHGPIQTIIPWASNLYTETLIRRVRAEMGADFWGFWMLGGMSGGGMGFIFEPAAQGARRRSVWQAIMRETKRRLERAVPFAMEPVVYDFAINERGTRADLLRDGDGADAARLLHADRAGAAAPRRRARCPPPAAPSWNVSRPPAAPCRSSPAWCRTCSTTCCRAPHETEPRPRKVWRRCSTGTASTAYSMSRSRRTCAAARIGLAQNRLPVSSRDRRRRSAGDIVDASSGLPAPIAKPACRRWRTAWSR